MATVSSPKQQSGQEVGVQADDEAGHAAGGEGSDSAVGPSAHDVGTGGEPDQRDQREGDTEAQHDLGPDERPGGICAEGQQGDGGNGCDQSADEQRDAAPQEAGHHHLAGVGAYRRSRQPEASRATANATAVLPPISVASPACTSSSVLAATPEFGEQLRGDDQHRRVDQTRSTHG